MNIIDSFKNDYDDFHALTDEEFNICLRQMMDTAFQTKSCIESHENIDIVYPKQPVTSSSFNTKFDKLINNVVSIKEDLSEYEELFTIEMAFEQKREEDNTNGGGDEQQQDFSKDEELPRWKQNKSSHKKYNIKDKTIFELLKDKELDRETKINYLTIHIGKYFPKLEGDKVTFIGSTFMHYGEQAPYKNTCIALDTCDDVEGSEPIIVCKTEQEVLLKWTELIQEEDPDIIIGYNIFGFDYKFMFERARENHCVEDFLKLSRNREEICGNETKEGQWRLEESSIVIASGQHDLYYIKMNGRLQIDLYNFLRRDYNLTSYKLDYVAGNFIGDKIKSINADELINKTTIKSKNLTGLLVGSYINFEEIGHSSEYYLEGKKFEVVAVDKQTGEFQINGIANPDMKTKIVKWGLAKMMFHPKIFLE